MRTPFLGSFYRSRSLNLDQQHCINLYLELAEHKRGKQKGMLLMTPGLDPLLTLMGAPAPSGGGGNVPVPAIYIAGQSCEVFRYPLTASGANPTPDVNITGTTSTLTGPHGNIDSITLGVDVDTSTGNLYVLAQSLAATWVTSIPVFAPNATGNVAPIHNIVGAATNLSPVNAETTNGGICLDGNHNIYAAINTSGSSFQIVKFSAGADGNATGTIIATEASLFATSLCYDATNNLIWASCYAGAPFTSLARSYTTSGTFHTQVQSVYTLAGEVFIGPAGQIVLASVGSGAKTVVEVFPSGSSGTPAATQTITINPAGAQGPAVSCAAMDSAGLLYIGPVFDVSLNAVIMVYPAGTSGTDPATLRSFYSSLFKQMADGTATQIQNIVIR